jgi:hypothetical protein
VVVKIKRAFKITRTKTFIAWFTFAYKYNNSTTRILTSKVWYHILLYNEQCKLAIHFAEHNFGLLWTYLFRNSLIRTRIQNTVQSVIFKSSDFHLLIRSLQNIYIFSAARETYIKTAVYILGVWKNRKSILQVKVLPVAWFSRASGYIWPSIHVARACE